MDKLSEESFIKILLNINSINDKKNLIITNKYFYNIGKKELKKYRIFKYVNEDYSNFYKILKKDNFDLSYSADMNIIDKTIIRSLMNIPIIYKTKYCGMYDLRFIFELLYFGYKIETNNIKIYNNHFYIHFYHKIEKCIIKNNRKNTIKNIEKCPYLFSLKQKPAFSSEVIKKDFGWVSIYKE